jgi:nitrogen fixation protein FixH
MLKNGAWFPWMLVAILLVSVGANIYLIIRATNDPSFAVEPDYYAKAVDWDRIQAQKAESDALGWNIVVDAGHAELRVELSDRLGQPISGALVEVEAFHNARAADRIRGVMIPRGGGAYAFEGPFERAGIWEYRITATTGDYTFRHVAQEELP